jgi:putative tricarboxylic transport membrane protein
MSDRIFGAVGLVLAAVFAWQATLIQESFLSDQLGPKVFPIIIAGVLALASLSILLRPDIEPVWPRSRQLGELSVGVVVMIAYAELLPVLGFVIATLLATAYLTWRLGTEAIWAPVVGLVTAVLIYVIFRKVLGLSLAHGPLDFAIDAVVDPIGRGLKSLSALIAPAAEG